MRLAEEIGVETAGTGDERTRVTTTTGDERGVAAAVGTAVESETAATLGARGRGRGWEEVIGLM